MYAQAVCVCVCVCVCLHYPEAVDDGSHTKGQ